MEAELQQFQDVYLLITQFVITYSFQILGAIIILALGYLAARRAGLMLQGVLLRHKVDVTLSRFSAAGLKILILAMVAIIALNTLGVSVTPFVAAVGAVSLGAGLALQGLLSNYGAGVSIIVTRPFVVGDTISVQGITGIVREVNLGSTILTNEDGVQITLPNKHVTGEIIHNSFTDSIVETSVDIAYHCDPQAAISLIRHALAGVHGISAQRLPQVGIDAFGERGITIGVRFWVRTEVMFQGRYHAHAEIHRVLRDNNIDISFPQREVRLLQENRLGQAS